MSGSGQFVRCCVLVVVATAWAGSIQAHEGHERHSSGNADKAAETASVRLPDVVLLDQDEKKLRLRDEVVGDKIVVVDFVYTSCTTVCPVVSGIMGLLQERLGTRLGSEVSLVSITVDPVRDTPKRLKRYAASHHARSGWTWLTGAQTDVTEALKGFGTYTSNFEEHPAVIMVGDGRTGRWMRFYGFVAPEQLLAQVDEFSSARGQKSSDAHGRGNADGKL